MTDERIIAYLLKELPEEESEQFEEQCFQQESWPEQINLVEEELIDDYLRGELAPEQRQHFELNYLTTAARQERVSVASILLRHVDECNAVATVSVKPDEPGWTERFRAFWNSQALAFRAGVAIAAIIIIVGAWWIFRPRPFAPRTFATLTLNAAGMNRGNAPQPGSLERAGQTAQTSTVLLPLNADALRISLKLPGGSATAARYRVEMENIHAEKKSLTIERQDAQSVSVLIPASQLARGQYVLKLSGVKDDGTEQRLGSYFFSVE